MTDQEPILTRDGERRRDRMLGDIQAEMTRVHRNRRLRRSSAGFALCAALVATLFVMVSERPSAPDGRVIRIVERPHSVKITRIAGTTVPAESISSGRIRMVEISTRDVLDTFAKANIAAGVRCAVGSEQCEIFFPGREDSGALIVQ